MKKKKHLTQEEIAKTLESIKRARPMWYYLDEKGEPQVFKGNVIEYCSSKGDAFNDPRRVVARTEVEDVLVSTVFLCLDHSWMDGPPVLWETMALCDDPKLHGEMLRCGGSREQAEAMHQRMVEHVTKRIAERKKKK